MEPQRLHELMSLTSRRFRKSSYWVLSSLASQRFAPALCFNSNSMKLCHSRRPSVQDCRVHLRPFETAHAYKCSYSSCFACVFVRCIPRTESNWGVSGLYTWFYCKLCDATYLVLLSGKWGDHGAMGIRT